MGLTDEDAAQRRSLLTADDVARDIVAGVEAGDFMILPHPAVKEYTMQRAQDPDRWITGMQMLRSKAQERFGAAGAQTLYKMI